MPMKSEQVSLASCYQRSGTFRCWFMQSSKLPYSLVTYPCLFCDNSLSCTLICSFSVFGLQSIKHLLNNNNNKGPRNRDRYRLHLTEEETEAHRGKVTGSRSQREKKKSQRGSGEAEALKPMPLTTALATWLVQTIKSSFLILNIIV